MRYLPVDQSGYVYCVRRLGKPYYYFGSAPGGEFCDRLRDFIQSDPHPPSLVTIGWIEVSDPEAAVTKLKESFYLYRMEHQPDPDQPDSDPNVEWFDLQATRTGDLKSLLDTYVDLRQKFVVSERLIDREVQPDYDQSFGFFEALNQRSGDPYYPVAIPATPTPTPSAKPRRLWIYGGAVAAIALLGVLGAKSFMTGQSVSQRSTSPSPKPSLIASPSPKPSPSNSPSPSPSPKPSSSPSPSPKPSPAAKPKPQAQPVQDPQPQARQDYQPQPAQDYQPEAPIANGPATVIWSPTSEGAKLRSNPDGASMDFLPNGTPVTLGEMSGAWQEVILPNGQRGWVSNSLVQE